MSILHKGSEIDKIIFDGKEINEVYYEGEKIFPPFVAEEPYISFIEENKTPFTLKTYGETKNWDGILEYSADTKNWEEWDGKSINSSANGELYLRGKNNTYLTGRDKAEASDEEDEYMWHNKLSFSKNVSIGCFGNIENLLDYEKVSKKQHPEMAERGLQYLFYECEQLVHAPELPTPVLTRACYRGMFKWCSALKETPELPAMELAPLCYYGMFEECSSIKEPPKLPATKMATACYHTMFKMCNALETAPELPAMELAPSCYRAMFSNTYKLETPPKLPATKLPEYCYVSMFYCSSITEAPEIPATEVGRCSCMQMFEYCEKLTKAPRILPAMNLDYSAYISMFKDCFALEEAPELPAKELAECCYQYMFENCTALKKAPEKLPATTLAYSCYQDMLNGCTALTGKIHCPASTKSNEDILKLDGSSEAEVVFDLDDNGNEVLLYLSFIEENGEPFTVKNYREGKTWNGTLEYSTDTQNWSEYSGAAISSSDDGKLYLRGSNNTTINNTSCFMGSFIITKNKRIKCLGNIENLLDYKSVAEGKHPVMGPDCYFYLFSGCTSLVQAPELPATKLSNQCYSYMFSGCTSLTQAPELPATILGGHCYYGMFSGCTSLVQAPELPATSVGGHCYGSMFDGCTSLTKAPEKLPATDLEECDGCYSGMFAGCTSLTGTIHCPASTANSFNRFGKEGNFPANTITVVYDL